MTKFKFIVKNSDFKNVGFVFAYFCGGHKNNFIYNFVAPLRISSVNVTKSAGNWYWYFPLDVFS